MIEDIIKYKESICIYISAVFISMIIAFIYDLRKEKISKISRIVYFALSSLPYSILIGFRGVDVGYDTKNYVYMYRNILDDEYFEILFRWICKVFFKLGYTKNYGYAFSVIAFITIFFFLYAVYVYDKKTSITFSLFVYLMFYGCIMTDQMRQTAAMSLFLVSIAYICKKEYKLAFLYGVIGCTMHTSVIFAYIVLVPISFLKLNSSVTLQLYAVKYYVSIRLFITIILSFIVIIFASNLWIKFFFAIVPVRYISYFTTRIDIQSIGFGIISDIIPIFLLLIIGFVSKKKAKDGIIYAYGGIGIIFRLLGYFSFFLARMAYYPNLVSIMALPSYINKYSIGVRIGLKMLVIFAAIWYFLMFSVHYNQHNAFPYYFLER